MLTVYTPGSGASLQVPGSSFVEMRDAGGLLCGIVWVDESDKSVRIASAGDAAFEEYRRIFKRNALIEKQNPSNPAGRS